MFEQDVQQVMVHGVIAVVVQVYCQDDASSSGWLCQVTQPNQSVDCTTLPSDEIC